MLSLLPGPFEYHQIFFIIIMTTFICTSNISALEIPYESTKFILISISYANILGKSPRDTGIPSPTSLLHMYIHI